MGSMPKNTEPYKDFHSGDYLGEIDKQNEVLKKMGIKVDFNT